MSKHSRGENKQEKQPQEGVPAGKEKNESKRVAFKEFLVLNRWTILTGAVPVVIAVVCWYFIECIGDRKTAVNGYRGVVVEHRSIADRDINAIAAYLNRFAALRTRLERSTLSPEDIRRELDEVVNLIKLAESTCQEHKKFDFDLRDRRKTVERLFRLQPQQVEEGGDKCSGYPRMLSMVRAFDINKLVSDAEYRNDFLKNTQAIEALYPQIRDKLYEFESLDKQESSDLTTIELRTSSPARNILDCCIR